MSRRTRIGHHQLEELRHSLTETDWQLLDRVSRFRLMSAHQLQRLHYGPTPSDSRRCRRQLAQLVEMGVLDRLPRRVGGRGRGSDSTVFRVGRAGQRLLQVTTGSGPAWQPSAVFAAHTLGIADLYVSLHEQQQLDRLQLIQLIEFTPEPAAWQDFVWQMKSVTLKPDAFMLVELNGIEHHYFVELDLGTESMAVIANKINRYFDYYQSGPELTVFPQVLFLVDSEASYHSKGTVERVEQIERVAASVLAERLQLVAVAAKNHPPWARDPSEPTTTETERR